jgi:hypothetical protein
MKQAVASPTSVNKRFSITKLAQDFVSDSTHAWNLSPRMIVLLEILPFLIAFSGVIAALLGKPAYKWFTQEDGFAEDAQVLFYSLALVLSLVYAHRQWRNGEKVVTFLFLGFSFCLFFLIGEEISWGQRIFGWQTAATIASSNKQDETNLHNIYGVGSTFKWIQMLVGAYGTILPLAILRWKVPARFEKLTAVVIPHFSLIPYFVMLFVWRIFRNLTEVPERFYFVVSEYNEVLELVLAVGLFLFMVYQLRKLRQQGINP